MSLSCESDTVENTVHRQAAKQTKIQNEILECDYRV